MKASYVAICAVLILLIAEANLSNAATCNPTELSPCMAAISSNTPPSSLCCSKIKAQKPCLCQYLKNPNIRKYIGTPSAQKVASTCGVPIPKC
ncbi:hypothetical protein M9H77_29013 [Catharanthus roseus]|uniref:Uncharacterized protein n=1 Tax=Catharanthus roseus TaxID=4058 RepID=A0ACC0AH86_CATRO|nr:hypothetical protein M9H77_29013 [Catharanthus roseus]